MRKAILALFIFSISVSYSQNSKFKFGLQTGLNYSKLRGYDTPPAFHASESPAFAYLAGVSIEYQINTKLSIKADLNYERKSQQSKNVVYLTENFDDPEETYRYKSKTHYDYIVLPILLKYSFKESNSFYVNGGVFIGYLIKSKITNDSNISGIPNDSDTTDLNQKLDYGLAVGVGKNFEFGSNKTLYVELRENLGLYNTSEVDVINDGTIKTNSLSLIAGILFN
jgi:hypothetical protein